MCSCLVQIGYSRTKLGTLVTFPITALDMTPFLAPRSSAQPHPSSATPLSSYKSGRSGTKSVHFEDEVCGGEQQKSPLGRSVSAGKGKGKRFLFPRKKNSTPTDKRDKKKNDSGKRSSSGGRRRSRSPEAPCSPPAGSESPMSVRSAPSTIERLQLKPHHRYFLPPSPLHHTPSRLDDSRLSNVYDLFAVCNHSGTLSRGHYTAFCKNPTDGRWYGYDDNSVQAISEEQLVSSGAYMLFYVRQSLMSSSPLSSSESSESSCNSANHWINHMPPFRLDLNDYHEELCRLQQLQLQQQQVSSQQGYEGQELPPSGGGDSRARSRLNSSNSVLSAPPNVGLRVSPPMSAHEVEGVASPGSGSGLNSHYSNHDARSDAFSAVSLPPYHHHSCGLTTSLNHTPTTPYSHTHSGRAISGGSVRHQSLRLREKGSGGWTTDPAPQRGYYTQRSHEDLHSQSSSFEPYNGHLHGYVAPTRSIPSLPTTSEIVQTPNRYSQEQRSFPATQGPLQHKSAHSNGHIPINVGSHFKSPSLARAPPPSNQPESCV